MNRDSDSPATGQAGLRVLLFTELGVTSRYFEGAAPLLVSLGVDVVVATVRQRGPLHEALEASGIPTLALDCRTSRDYPWAAVRLAREVRRRRIDVIHACEPIPATIGGFAGILARRGRRIFRRQHCSVSGPQLVLSRLGSRIAHLVMANSEASARSAHEEDGVPFSKVRVAYNGIAPLRAVSPQERAASRHDLGIPVDAPVISIVAHLRPGKGHHTLFESMGAVGPALGARPHVVVVGGGPEEGALREAARSAPAVVHFVGHQKDVAPWFSMADVVAMPTFVEAFGLVAVEALSCARPLVASRVGGLVEIVEDGVSGLLVEPRSPEALAAGLLRVLRSPELAERLGRAGLERSRLFSMESMVDGWRACYEDVLASGRPSARLDAGRPLSPSGRD